MPPLIDTPRLRLRTVVDTDVPALFSIFRDEESMRYWSRPAMSGLDEAEALMREIEEKNKTESFAQWGITLREDDTVIGTCTLHRIVHEHRRAEVGYIVRRDLWGRGLAGEALGAMVAYAFDALGLHRLEADIDPRNAASVKLIERLGFKREGLLRERYFVAQDIQDSLIYGLLAPEWKAR